MSSYIADNLKELSKEHYIRRAGAADYWFDFTHRKLKEYQTKYGDSFCLVLYASETEDDSYIWPYLHIKHLFKGEYLDKRQRWVGSIANNVLHIRHSNQSMSVSAYYNAFEYLEDESNSEFNAIKEPEVLYEVDKKIQLAHLLQRIHIINEKYHQSPPRKQKQISEYISRPNAITDYLKARRNYTCQICNQVGFVQRNGSQYVEAHHLIELHKLIPGSLCSDNIVIVCANCHRKFHYANVVYRTETDINVVSGEINGKAFKFERNVIVQAE